ncbi:hypothetical protein XENTR_v10004100 [Xenopus tropicalis]|nr:hypothetical protein XENTR_v10004100 [Xenopus tropicalis]
MLPCLYRANHLEQSISNKGVPHVLLEVHKGRRSLGGKSLSGPVPNACLAPLGSVPFSGSVTGPSKLLGFASSVIMPLSLWSPAKYTSLFTP